MELNKELVLDILFFIILIIVSYFGYKLFYNDNNNEQNKESFVSFSNVRPCYEGDTKIKNLVDSLSEILNGLMYDDPITVCIARNNEAYCLDSTVIKTDNISVVFFDTSCYVYRIQSNKFSKIVVPEVYAEKVNNVSDLLRLYNNGYIYVEDHNIIKYLENPEEYIKKKLSIK